MYPPVKIYLGSITPLHTKAQIISTIRYLSTGTPSHSASSSRNPYPFPTHRNPTPRQIFHLDVNATSADIKSRYYELVKLYHPDTAAKDGMSPKACRERFQRITVAYTQLRRGSRKSKLPTVSDVQPNRRWTGQFNEWGGFKYEYFDHGNDGTNGKPLHEAHAPYWLFFSSAILWTLLEYIYVSPSQDAWRHSRNIAQNRSYAQHSKEEHETERKEELKLWAELERRKEKDHEDSKNSSLA
ncbi:hypothetical protein FRB95_009490 [Tulasnella sp. JGI-2019a]|nr:hypothetical protein FRB93_004112 [Tulasnella sp. JGI-2019a]KAG9026031.1 hypothetical protein FRB95_009490 [Tulasnella sp. JGI-2019a]